MQHSEILLTIGEVAVTFAGFAGIVILFLRRDAGTWVAADVSRFSAMLAFALGALLFSLLPFLLLSAQRSETTTWCVCSVLLALFTALMLVNPIRAILRSDSGEFNPSLVAVIVGGSVLSFLVLLSNALGFVFHRGFTGYLAGLFWLVFAASILFARLVYLGVQDRLRNPSSDS
jgi:hypothetical protein